MGWLGLQLLHEQHRDMVAMSRATRPSTRPTVMRPWVALNQSENIQTFTLSSD